MEREGFYYLAVEVYECDDEQFEVIDEFGYDPWNGRLVDSGDGERFGEESSAAEFAEAAFWAGDAWLRENRDLYDEDTDVGIRVGLYFFDEEAGESEDVDLYFWQ